MTRLFLIAFTIIFTTSCYHEHKPQVIIPETILSEEQMVSILTDLYIVESAIAYHRKNKELTEEISTRYYLQMFDKHGINHRILKENLRYYNSTPEMMEDMMEDMLANLSILQSEVMAIATSNDTVTDAEADATWFYLINDTVTGIFYDSILQVEIDTIFNIIHNYTFRDVKDTVSESEIH